MIYKVENELRVWREYVGQEKEKELKKQNKHFYGIELQNSPRYLLEPISIAAELKRFLNLEYLLQSERRQSREKL